jgi:hypothetical protein
MKDCGCNGRGKHLTVSTNGQHASVSSQPPPGMPRFKVVNTPDGRDREGLDTYRAAKIAKAQAGGGQVVTV